MSDASAGVGDQVEGYTREELDKAIADKKKELSETLLSIKQSTLNIVNMEKTLSQGTVMSNLKGKVLKLADPVLSQAAGEPFLVVESEEGYYITGDVSEFLLGDLSQGQEISGTAYESGTSFNAEIREIKAYPDTNAGQGNTGESFYPFTAFIADPSGLKDGEEVSFNLTVGAEDTDSLYISKAFVRQQDGVYYVYIADSDGKLKKQNVECGRTVYGSSIQIKNGITADDLIAFPYGKTVREGAKTVQVSVEQLYT